MTHYLNHAAAAFAAIALSLGSLTAIVTVPPMQANSIQAPMVA